MGHPVVHFEMNGPDPAALARFYADLFAWHTQETPGGYWLIDTHAGSGINGGIGHAEEGRAFGTFYVQTPDPEALMRRAEQAGATVVMPITETSVITYGQFADPDGLVVGIVKADQGPGVSPGHNPPVDWFEVTGSDPKRTQDFYTELFGWEIDRSGDTTYEVVQHGHDEEGRDVQIGGGLGGSGTMWATVYARVPDVDAALHQAESLGGKLAYGPVEPMQGLKTGAFHDLAGNPFGVYQSG